MPVKLLILLLGATIFFAGTISIRLNTRTIAALLPSTCGLEKQQESPVTKLPSPKCNTSSSCNPCASSFFGIEHTASQLYITLIRTAKGTSFVINNYQLDYQNRVWQPPDWRGYSEYIYC